MFLVIVVTVRITVRTFRAVFRIMSVGSLMLAVRAVDVLRAPVRVTVGMRVYDLRVRKHLFSACALGKTQHTVGIGTDLFNIVGDHDDRDFSIDIQMVKNVKQSFH